MRIAYLINQYPKISHSFIRREILALEKQGFEVVRLALRGWDDELVDADDKEERCRTHYVLRGGSVKLTCGLFATLFRRPARFLRALKLACCMARGAERPLALHIVYLAEACCIANLLRRSEVGHLHAHFGTNSAEVAMLAHVLGGPAWSFTVHGPEEFDKAPLLGMAEKIRRCSFVVAVSSFGRSQLFRLVEQKYWPKIHVVHCGLDDAFLNYPSHPPSDAQRLVCVGRLCEQKGQLLLIDAAQRLVTEKLTFQLVLAGDGDMRKELEARIQSGMLHDHVRITGWIGEAQVKEEILAARALVLPSFGEGLPVVLMEAMALHRPVISTYIAGIPELVRDGEHGWLVPAGDVEALAEAMRACVASSPSTLMRMGQAGHERVLTSYNVDVEAAKLAAAISQVASEH